MTSHPGAERWVGRRVPRTEDDRLVRGNGRYLEDLPTDGLLHAFVVRSTEAHARFTVDVEEARAAPGVRCVLTSADLGDANAPLPVIWAVDGLSIPPYRPLADGVVRHVGQPIAVIVADHRTEAEDAAELVLVDYERLTVLTDPLRALDADAPILHATLGTNEAYRTTVAKGDVNGAFAAADIVVEATFDVPRQTACPMERRGVLARVDDATGRLTIWATIQHPHLYKGHVADALGLPHDDVRVIVPDLGGAFGAYYEVYPEDIVVPYAARLLGRPVRWIEDRDESFLSTVHAREQHHEAALALSADGQILALRTSITTDLGAYVDYSGVGPSFYTANFLTGPYDIQVINIDLVCVFTNKVRNGAYRGFGQPEATFVLERLVDLGARALSMDPVELRRRNVIQPDAFPYTLASGGVMDSGDYPGLIDLTVDAFDYAALRARAAALRAAGRAVGVGVALYTEATGSSPSATLAKRGYDVGGWEQATVRIERDGGVTAFSGASHLGQGIRTALAQVCADQLGVRPDEVKVVTGDTDAVRHGNRGAVGSRSAVIAGQAMNLASDGLARRVREAAAELFEASPDDLELVGGRVQVRGTPAMGMELAELAQAAYRRKGTGDAAPLLEESSFWDPPQVSFGSGSHAAVVEVDRRTGAIRIDRYLVVHDCGTVINPMIVEGQIAGGTVQGIAGALFEELVYDEDGQLRTGTLMDYLVPTAMDVPDIEILHQETPSPFHPLGVKGCGEAGTVGPAAALANAVADALDSTDVNRLPLTPERVWRLATGP